jgi:hypothetical protein
VNEPSRVTSGGPAIAALVASYDVLRHVALGRPGRDDGPPLGFTVLLRHGMAAWLYAWAQCPSPPRPSMAAPPIAIPSLVHTELAHVWAHMALAHQEAAWI